MFSSQRGSDLFRLKKIRDIFDWFLSRLFSADFSRFFCSETFVEVWLKNPFSISCLPWKGREPVTVDMTDGIQPLFNVWMYPKLEIIQNSSFVSFFQTYSAISKNENSGSRESLPSQFPATGSTDLDNGSSGHRRTFSDQARSLLRISIRFNLVSLLNAAYQPSAQIAEKLTFAVVTVQWLAWLPCHLKVMDWIRFLIPSIIIFSWEPAVWIGLVSSDSERDFKGWRD